MRATIGYRYSLSILGSPPIRKHGSGTSPKAEITLLCTGIGSAWLIMGNYLEAAKAN